MRFQRLPFPRHGKFRRSILLRSVHRTDTIYARTFSFLDSPLQLRPFEFRNPPAPITAALPVLTKRRSLYRPRLFRGNPQSVSFSAPTSSRTTACRSPNVAMPLSPCDPRLFGLQREKTRCPKCQQADSAVGIWTDLNARTELGSRRACTVSGELPSQRTNSCSRNLLSQLWNSLPDSSWGLRTLRYHVLPCRIWIRTCSTRMRPGCDPAHTARSCSLFCRGNRSRIAHQDRGD
jgi:hypothetical protein